MSEDPYERALRASAQSQTRPTAPRGPAPKGKAPPPPEDPVAVVEEVLKTDFQKRARAEADRFTQSTDSEYWVCVCFETRAQKDAFLRGLKLDDLGDKHIDGLEVARRLDVPLPDRATFAEGKQNPKLAALAKRLTERED